MKNTSTARPRSLALLLAATVLPAAPAFAQDTVAPPPVTATTPQAEAPAVPPATMAPAPAPSPVFAPRAEVVQPLPVRPAPAPEAAPAEPASRATVTRNAPRPRAATPPVAATPVAATPVAGAPVAAPVAMTPVPVPTPDVSPEPAALVASEMPSVTSDATQTSTATTTTQSPWMWIVGGLVALGAIIGLLLARRRRSVDALVYEEPAYVEATVAVAPVVEPAPMAPVYTPPVAPVSVEKVTTVAEDERPWIGLSLQATGSNERGEEDLVEYNLIVENAGEVMANDVRISTFLIDGRTKSSESETALIDAVGETQSRFIDLAPGTSVPIASTLSVPHGVDPCIIAEAHYPLPGGGEGHIAARFVIEHSKGDMVEARLDDVLERV